MHIVFCCTDTPPEPWLAGLRAALPEAEVSLWQADAPVHTPADIAVVWAPPQAFLDAQPGLRVLFNIGAGVDALLRLRLPDGLQIVRLDDAGMAVQMAEYVCHAVIGHYRGFGAYQQAQTEAAWRPGLPGRRADFTVGVMGLGVLGTRVAQALRGFDFPVMGWSRSPKTLAGVQTFHGHGEGLHAFLAASQVLVNLLPLTPQTRDILNRDTLGRLRPGAYLVNVARGAHLVEEDLLALLEHGHLAGATLDVFRTEPLPASHPFWTHPRITVTPHTSARTLRDESIAQIAGKIRALQRGQTIAGVVDVARGY
jgi:glyoxylate/hydroxypyruvate reductase